MTVASRVVCLGMAVLTGLASAGAAERIERDDLGRGVKLKILVDKVLTRVGKGKTEEWMIADTAKAGFNVWSRRVRTKDLSDVRETAAWCRKHGIYYIPWMRGGLGIPRGAEPDDRCIVWATGVKAPLWSPNSDELWDWLHSQIVEMAKISAENPHLMGVFLDFENYAPGPYLYPLSYDGVILNAFAKARGLNLPELKPEQRRDWLQKQGLHDDFEAFQIEHWRERCRKLRQAVDKYNPAFQFCIYPAPNVTLFLRKAAIPEWATEKAPVIFGDPSTYSKSPYQSEAEVVKLHRQRLEKTNRMAREFGVPFMHVGGTDPAVANDAEFCGKNAILCSELSDGYWVFYEGVKFDGDHPEFFKWWTWANEQIDAGNFAAQYAERKTPEDLSLRMNVPATLDLKGFIAPPFTGKTVEYDAPPKMRFINLFLVSGQAGKEIRIEVRNTQVGPDRPAPLVWKVLDDNQEVIASGSVPTASDGVITFTPARDGICLLGMSSGACFSSVLRSNAPVGVIGGEPIRLRLFGGAQRLYFHVPAGAEGVEVSTTVNHDNAVQVTLYNPAGKKVASELASPAQATAVLQAVPGEHADAVWALEIGQAPGAGRFAGNVTRLGKGLPPVFSFRPDQVFRLKSGK